MQRLFVFALFLSLVSGATITAKGGPWSNPNSWTSGKVPANQDDVIIPDGATITLDTQTANIVLLHIEDGGALIFDNGKGEADTELAITVETFFVAGLLQMGTDQTPLSRPARVVLVNYQAPIARGAEGSVFEILNQPYGKKVLLVYEEGQWIAHAKGRRPVWTRLAASVNRDDTTLTLIENVDWKVGDQIIITSTDFNADQTERNTIKAVNGKTVTLQYPLKWGHFGKVLDYLGFPVDMRAEVGVLTSNLRIYGDMTNSANYTSALEPAYAGFDEFMQFGGHTAGIHNATMKLEGLEMWNMGQGARLGRYPIHWHFMYNAPGQYLKRSALHDNLMRCISVHTTNNITVEDVICLDTYGHSVYQEDGDEYDNVFKHVLAVKSRVVGNTNANDMSVGAWKWPACATNPPGLRLQYVDSTPSGFWITNTNVTMIDNVAVGHKFGFWVHVEAMFNEPDYPHGCTTCAAGCKFPGHAHATYSFNKMVFRGNSAHSNEVGWWVKENWVPGNYWDLQIMEYFTVYKNGNGVMNYGINNMNWTNVISADNAEGFQTDWVRGGRVVLSNSIFIKETENFGNVYDNASIVIPANCSAIFPGQARTWSTPFAEHTGNILAVQMGDESFSMENVYFVNYKPNCLEVNNFRYVNYCGTTFFPFKRQSVLSPAVRTFENLYFVNSTFVNSYHQNTTCRYYSGTPDSNKPNSPNYMTGFLDKSGSIPCGKPNSYWMWPNKNGIPDDCTYYKEYDMYNCPPFKGAYDRIFFGNTRIWTGGQYAWNGVNMTWDCGKNVTLSNNAVIVRTDKNYILDLTNNMPTSPRGITLNGGSWEFPGMWITLVMPGTFKLDYYYFCSWPPNKGFNSYPQYIQSQCHCNVTYAKVYIPAAKNLTDGPDICTGEFVWDPIDAANVTCDSVCGNPWPVPKENYVCGQNLVVETNAGCGYKAAPRYTGLDWVKNVTGTMGSSTTDEDMVMSEASMRVVLIAAVFVVGLLF
eukprot:TRINITY_DN911_c0_g1_i4.p1 TRINITY_DN911_c0_g1~~TRINITY_DN911_c0_g1_i4.p1  ORF type:complete len:982 (-),score=247.99 TRINITY_DN911_c0_g1_i4:64-3009(-)